MTTVRIRSGDGVVFEMDLEAVKLSETLSTVVEHYATHEKAYKEDAIPVPVHSRILKMVIAWATYHTFDDEEMEWDEEEDKEMTLEDRVSILNKPPLKLDKDKKLKEEEEKKGEKKEEKKEEKKITPSHPICIWDKHLLNVDEDTLMELIEAANYLDFQGLADTACKAIANVIHTSPSLQMFMGMLGAVGTPSATFRPYGL